ncbi:MAG TPA: hypothetical protein VGF35_04900 [Steroidobacteraceae bacterium]|jgi:hypothetical protein
MSALSQWLQLMLAEITRKQEDQESAHAELRRRALEQEQAPPPAAAQVPGTRR